MGFEIRQYRVKCRKKGYVTLIKPSKKLQKNHAKILKDHIKQCIAVTQEELIKQLNPIITGWSNYCKTYVASKVFGRLDDYMFHRLWSWACKRHPNKGKRWIKRKYFRNHKGGSWRFKTHERLVLKFHKDTLIRRHIQIKCNKSPFDGDKEYWQNRLRREVKHDEKRKCA